MRTQAHRIVDTDPKRGNVVFVLDLLGQFVFEDLAEVVLVAEASGRAGR